VRLRERGDLCGVAADQHRVGHDPPPRTEQDAALVPDCDDRADEVLVRAHAAGNAVHDHAEADSFHAGGLGGGQRRDGEGIAGSDGARGGATGQASDAAADRRNPE
jgi:hypothetical protein